VVGTGGWAAWVVWRGDRAYREIASQSQSKKAKLKIKGAERFLIARSFLFHSSVTF